MIIKDYVMDGVNVGVAINYLDNNGSHYLRKKTQDGTNKVRLYKSVSTAALAASYFVSNDAAVNLQLCFDDVAVSIDSCQKIGNTYQIFKDDTLIRIEENQLSILIGSGYFVFENGDTERSDRLYGVKIQDTYLKIIKDMFYTFIMYNIKAENFSGNLIERIERKSNKEYVIKLNNSSVKIHIMLNSALMDLNQYRKSKFIGCIPFDKNMDKYTTIFCYITRDPSEPSKANSILRAEYILSFISGVLKELYPDFNGYRDVKFDKKIIVKED